MCVRLCEKNVYCCVIMCIGLWKCVLDWENVLSLVLKCIRLWKCGKTSVKMCVILCERMCKTCENMWDSVKKCKTSVKMCVRLCENVCKTSLNEQCEKLVKTSVWRFVLFRSNKNNNNNRNNNNNNNFATYRIAAQACDQKSLFFP